MNERFEDRAVWTTPGKGRVLCSPLTHDDLGRRSIAVVADVSKGAQVVRIVESTDRDLGPIDVLINNAGAEAIIPLLEISKAELERVTLYL